MSVSNSSHHRHPSALLSSARQNRHRHPQKTLLLKLRRSRSSAREVWARELLLDSAVVVVVVENVDRVRTPESSAPPAHSSSRKPCSTISTLRQIISHQATHNRTILLQLPAQQSSPEKILHRSNSPLVAPRSSMEVVAVVRKVERKRLDRNT
ncbi:hypothetical protein Q7P35_005991 [Cladosporium inversicolor]